MKNRLISLLLCLVLCMSLLPMAALAEDIQPLAVEDGEAMPEPTAEPDHTVEPEVTAEPTATPEVTAEPTEELEPATAPEVTPELTAEPEVTPEPTPEPTATPEPELVAVMDGETTTPVDMDKVNHLQALINALPDKVTKDNCDQARQQYNEINALIVELTDEEKALVNYERYSDILWEILIIDVETKPVDDEGGTVSGIYKLLTQDMFDHPDKYPDSGLIFNTASKQYVLKPDNYMLKEDIEISRTLVIENGTELCLNWKKLEMKGSDYAIHAVGRLFINKPGLICGDDGPGIYVGSGADVTMNEATLAGFIGDWGYSGAAVVVDENGRFTMDGGKIQYCTSYKGYSAGAVYLHSNSSFTMKGGTIEHCATLGNGAAGAVYMSPNSAFIMEGSATIQHCRAQVDSSVQGCAGAVVIRSDSNGFSMGSGTITDCWTTGSSSAGGVLAQGRFNMSSNAKIVNCDSGSSSIGSAGGVYVAGGANVTGTLTIDSCKSKNGGCAGGMYVASGANLSVNARIKQCECRIDTVPSTPSAGGVYVAGDASLTLTDASQIYTCNTFYFCDGAAQNAAGGIYNAGTLTMNGTGQIFGCAIAYNSDYPLDFTTGTHTVAGGLMNVGTFTLNSTYSSAIASNAGTKLLVSSETYSQIDPDPLDMVNAPGSTMHPNNGTVGTLVNYGTIASTTSAAPTKFTNGTNHGAIQAANFNASSGKLDNYGTISGGIYKCTVECSENSVVSGGDFAAATRTDGKPYQVTFYYRTYGAGAESNENHVYETQWRYNAQATQPTPDPTHSVIGYQFIGWKQENNNDWFSFTERTTSDRAARTVWSDALITYPTTKSGLIYDGTDQELLDTLGSFEGHTFHYSLDNGETWTTDASQVQRKNAQTDIVILYKVVNDTNEQVVSSGEVHSKIDRKPATATVWVDEKTYDGTVRATVCGKITQTDGAVAGECKEGYDYITITELSGTYDSKNVGTGKTVTVAPYNALLDGADMGNYDVTYPPTVTGDVVASEIIVRTASAKNKTYDGTTAAEMICEPSNITGRTSWDDLSVVVTGTFSDANVGNGKTVTITGMSLAGADAGNYVFAAADEQQKTATADITKRPVTLESASESKAYDGTALKAETVTATGMVDGEEFDYDFTGSQTDIGASENKFTAKNSDTAKVANYNITYDYGTLRVTVPAGIGDGTEDMTVDTVTSDDREVIEDTLKSVDEYLGMEPTKDEATKLNELEDKLHELLDRLDEAKEAAEDRTITKTDKIDKDNAKPSDKQKLEDAKDAIEKALEDYDTNLTDEEKQELNDKLDRINAALDAIAAAEAAKAVKTGDEAMPMLWLALALSAALTLGYTARKKKN